MKIQQSASIKSIALIRLSVGVIFLSEGTQKFIYPESLGSGRFAKIGLLFPEVLGPLVGCTEITAGSLILLGFLTRLAVVPTICIMLVALWTTKFPLLIDQGFWKMAHEARTDFAMLLASIFLFIVGSGPVSLDFITSKCLQKNKEPK